MASQRPVWGFRSGAAGLHGLGIEHGGGGVPLLAGTAGRFAKGEDRRDLPQNIVKAMVVPADGGPHKKPLSRKELDELDGFVKQMRAPGLARAKVAEDGTWTQTAWKGATAEFARAVNAACGAKPWFYTHLTPHHTNDAYIEELRV